MTLESSFPSMLRVTVTPPPNPEYLAYWHTGDDTWIAGYLDDTGALIDFIGTPIDGPTSAPDYDRCAPIVSDGTDTVGAGSLIQPFGGVLYVFDFVGGAPYYSYDGGDDDMAGGAHVGDYVYAVTHEASSAATSTVRIVRLNPDLTGASVVASADLDPSISANSDWADAKSVAVAADRVFLASEWSDFDTFQFADQAIMIPFSGSAEQGEPAAGEAGPGSLGLPWSTDKAIRGRYRWRGGVASGEGWEEWGGALSGDEGGPSSGTETVVYEYATRGVLSVDPDDIGTPVSITLPATFDHPTEGTLTAPRLVFPVS